MQSASRERADHPARSRAAVLAVAALAAAFFAGTLLAPLVAGSAAGPLLRLFYAPVCHQMPERSLAVAGGHQAVCARCAGLYVGGVAGLVAGAWLVTSSVRLRPWWLVAAAAPTVVDALLPWVGGAGLPNLPRLVVALPAGAVVGLFLAAGVADVARPRGPSERSHRPVVEGVDG